MPRVAFTANLGKHLEAPPAEVEAATVREALDSVFFDAPRLRSYILDEQGALRKHVHVFVSGRLVKDRNSLSDPVEPHDEIYVMQALSGG